VRDLIPRTFALICATITISLVSVESGFSGLVNINSATQAELETLPGIGPVKARRIIELRRQKGRFSRVEELEEAYGIGPKTVEALRPLCCVRDAPRQTVSSATPPAPDVQGVQSVRC